MLQTTRVAKVNYELQYSVSVDTELRQSKNENALHRTNKCVLLFVGKGYDFFKSRRTKIVFYDI